MRFGVRRRTRVSSRVLRKPKFLASPKSQCTISNVRRCDTSYAVKMKELKGNIASKQQKKTITDASLQSSFATVLNVREKTKK